MYCSRRIIFCSIICAAVCQVVRSSFDGPGDCQYTTKGQEYAGKEATTYKGTTCLPWTEFAMDFSEVVNPSNFLRDGGSVSAAMNYCRNPDGKQAGPWCFVQKVGALWDYCNVNFCPYKKLQGTPEQSSEVDGAGASLAMDGDNETCSETEIQVEAYWQINLESPALVHFLKILRRIDSGDREFTIFDTENGNFCQQDPITMPAKEAGTDEYRFCTNEMFVNSLQIKSVTSDADLKLCEVEIFPCGYWTKKEGTKAILASALDPGAMNVSDVENKVQKCQDACVKTPHCVAVDIDNTLGICYFYLSDYALLMGWTEDNTDYDHYILTRCPRLDCGSVVSLVPRTGLSSLNHPGLTSLIIIPIQVRGYVSKIRYFAARSGVFYLGVYRYADGSGEIVPVEIKEVVSTGSGLQEATIRLHLEFGDKIGVHYPEETSGGKEGVLFVEDAFTKGPIRSAHLIEGDIIEGVQVFELNHNELSIGQPLNMERFLGTMALAVALEFQVNSQAVCTKESVVTERGTPRENPLIALPAMKSGSNELVVFPSMKTSYEGRVQMWRCFTQRAGIFYLSVWRYTADKSKLVCVGINTLHSLGNFLQEFWVGLDDQIAVHAGDMFGVHQTANDTESMLYYQFEPASDLTKLDFQHAVYTSSVDVAVGTTLEFTNLEHQLRLVSMEVSIATMPPAWQINCQESNAALSDGVHQLDPMVNSSQAIVFVTYKVPYEGFISKWKYYAHSAGYIHFGVFYYEKHIGMIKLRGSNKVESSGPGIQEYTVPAKYQIKVNANDFIGVFYSTASVNDSVISIKKPELTLTELQTHSDYHVIVKADVYAEQDPMIGYAEIPLPSKDPDEYERLSVALDFTVITKWGCDGSVAKDPTLCTPLAIGTKNKSPDFFILFSKKVLLHKNMWNDPSDLLVGANYLAYDLIDVFPGIEGKAVTAMYWYDNDTYLFLDDFTVMKYNMTAIDAMPYSQVDGFPKPIVEVIKGHNSKQIVSALSWINELDFGYVIAVDGNQRMKVYFALGAATNPRADGESVPKVFPGLPSMDALGSIHRDFNYALLMFSRNDMYYLKMDDIGAGISNLGEFIPPWCKVDGPADCSLPQSVAVSSDGETLYIVYDSVVREYRGWSTNDNLLSASYTQYERHTYFQGISGKRVTAVYVLGTDIFVFTNDFKVSKYSIMDSKPYPQQAGFPQLISSFMMSLPTGVNIESAAIDTVNAKSYFCTAKECYVYNYGDNSTTTMTLDDVFKPGFPSGYSAFWIARGERLMVVGKTVYRRPFDGEWGQLGDLQTSPPCPKTCAPPPLPTGLELAPADDLNSVLPSYPVGASLIVRCQQYYFGKSTVITCSSDGQFKFDMETPAKCRLMGSVKPVAPGNFLKHDTIKVSGVIDLRYPMPCDGNITSIRYQARGSDNRQAWDDGRTLVFFIASNQDPKNRCSFGNITQSEKFPRKNYGNEIITRPRTIRVKEGDHFGFWWPKFGIVAYDQVSDTQNYCTGGGALKQEPKSGSSISYGLSSDSNSNSPSHRDYAMWLNVVCAEPAVTKSASVVKDIVADPPEKDASEQITSEGNRIRKNLILLLTSIVAYWSCCHLGSR